MSENNINRVKVFLKGDIIFHEGQPSDHFYVLQKGEVEVSIRKNERRFVIGTLGPGEFFGEMGLLSNEPRSASCRAITPVEVARISNDDFKKLLKNSHPLVGKIINVLLKRLKKSNSLSANKTASTNIFYAVANLLDLNFKAANSNSILAGLFIKQITATLGILPHQAKAILQRFSDFGLIQKIQNKANSSSLQDEEEGRLLLQSDNLLMEAIIIQDQEPDKVLPESFSSELELMEIKEALELYGIDQKKFYSKMCAGDFPDHLFFINKSVLFSLIQGRGKQFFEEPGA
ncbi:MAG TPA: cyclic nucleotide-binding domain-containing protein [Methylobacter sp.]|jgi:CRP-like cAMP-binding protein/predicted DNA-binding transcriptional regulator AlpA